MLDQVPHYKLVNARMRNERFIFVWANCHSIARSNSRKLVNLRLNRRKILVVSTKLKQLWKENLKKKSGLNGIETHGLCDASVVLYQLSYQANRELGTNFTSRDKILFPELTSCYRRILANLISYLIQSTTYLTIPKTEAFSFVEGEEILRWNYAQENFRCFYN